MSVLRMKSKINQDAAAHLQNQLYFPPVVHCAYYSCVQLMRHILLFEKGWSDWEMEKERRTSGRLGPHEYLINKISNELEIMNADHRTFYKEIDSLKKLHVSADYKNHLINWQISNKAILLSTSITNYLKISFSIC